MQFFHFSISLLKLNFKLKQIHTLSPIYLSNNHKNREKKEREKVFSNQVFCCSNMFMKGCSFKYRRRLS